VPWLPLKQARSQIARLIIATVNEARAARSELLACYIIHPRQL
jgi:hypothetical protein